MKQEICDELFNAVLNDDVKKLSHYIKGNENIAFGRFPVLSLCYLYGSKKIIRKYKKILLKINEYKIVDEKIEIYSRFKQVAGRCLRLYLDENSLVSPLEMLAIMGKENTLTKSFTIAEKNEKIINNLKSIFKIFAQQIEIKNDKIKISTKPFSEFQKRNRLTVLIVFSSFILVLLLSQAVIGISFGLATGFSYFEIDSEKQLYLALNSNGCYKLTSDIEIENFESIDTFSGDLDGDNHFLFVNSLPQESFINKNKGNVKNLKIIFADGNINLAESYSLFVCDNFGTIENISVVCGNIIFVIDKSQNSEISVNAISVNNYGTIKNCEVKANISLEGNSSGDCFVSAFAGINSGIVESCTFLEDSSVSSIEVDIAGIVCENKLNAQVVGCKNYAKLSQISSSEQWSPNVGGIAISNYGIIKNSKNFAELSIISNNAGEQAQGSVFLAGISAFNYRDIIGCLNKGNLIVSSKRILVYCGGIAAYSSYSSELNNSYISKISGCGTQCQLNLSTENESAFVFAGGISGYFYGEMIDCYTLASFVNGNNQEKYFVGNAIGVATVWYHLFGSGVYANFDNIYALKQDNITYQIGSLIYDGNIISVGIDDSDGGIIVTDIDTILQQEIYWNEK